MSEITYSYEFCGLKLSIVANVEAGEPQTHTDPGTEDSAEILSAHHKGDELDLDEVDQYIELEKAAFTALHNNYVDSAVDEIESRDY